MTCRFDKKHGFLLILLSSPSICIKKVITCFNSKNIRKHYKLIRNILLIICWISVNILNMFTLELFQRQSFDNLIFYIKNNYISLVANLLIYLSLTSFAFLFKKKTFFMVALSGLIFLPGLANGFMWKLRGTPLTIPDLYSVKEGVAIAHEYVNIQNVITGVFLLTIFVITLVFLWKYTKEKILLINKKTHIFLLIILPLFLCTTLYINKNIKNDNLSIMLCDLNASYMKNGFLYSFINTASGLQNIKPENYNKNNIESIKQDIFLSNTHTMLNNNTKPNVIIVQLESVFDPCRLKNITFNKEYIPNIKKLTKQNSSGCLKVPTYGGGTIKTEFEVLTGMSISNLKVGTLPSNDILKKHPIESIAYVLNDNNYNSSVVHNYFGSFYNRHETFANVGFNNFVTFEYMENKILRQFPQDILNLKPIEQLLKNNTPQFIYNITVETHAPYTTDKYDKYDFKSNIELSKESKDQLQCYLDKLKNTDEYIGKLMDSIKKSNRPTIVIGFGDHLPRLDIINNGEGLKDNNIYDTQYFIWDNIGLKKSNKTLKSYQLSSYVLNLLGITDGVIPKFHNTYMNSNEYDDKLKLLQYDILFGKQYIYNGKSPYKKKNLQLGLNQPIIKKVYTKDNTLILEGENFTHASKIFINNKSIETLFVDSNLLTSTQIPQNIKEIKIVQVSLYDKILSSSKKYIAQ